VHAERMLPNAAHLEGGPESIDDVTRVIGCLVLCVVASAIATAHADARGEVITSTSDTFAVRDAVRDTRDIDGTATGSERRAGDIRRVKVWKEGRRAYVRVTVADDVQAVDGWTSWLWLYPPRDAQAGDVGMFIRITRAAVSAHIYNTDQTQSICPSRRRVDVSNQGRTVTARLLRGCHWRNLTRVAASVLVERPDQPVARDVVNGRCHLKWR
jgi:hypothetical protein